MMGVSCTIAPRHDTGRVDPRRVLRALRLVVEPVGSHAYRVSGGSRPHIVRVHPGEHWRCDCADAARACKHILSVYLHRQLAPAVRDGLRRALRGGAA